MKSLISSRMAVVVLASLAVVALSSCNKKNNESVSSNPDNSPSTSSTTSSPAGSGTTTASPSTAASSGSAAGVAPQGATCPTGNPVKGVTSQKLGGKVALTTTSPVYSTTKPEKCFPTTAAAQTAGYKVPK